jgi:hypothetical protein
MRFSPLRWQVRLSAFVGRHEDAGKPGMPGGPPKTSHRVFGALVAEKLQVLRPTWVRHVLWGTAALH